MTTINDHYVIKKADSLEFVWHNLELDGPMPQKSEEFDGLKWKVRLGGSNVGDDESDITFKISCNEYFKSMQWSAKGRYSIELFSSPDMTAPIDKRVGAFSSCPSDRYVSVSFGNKSQICEDQDDEMPIHSNLSSCDDDEEMKEKDSDDEKEDEYRSKVTHCRCVLFDISSTGLKLSRPVYLAPWKLTDENIPHDKVLLVDGVKFYIQSQVLSLWSPYFDTLFDSKFSESQTNEIEQKYIDAKDFEQLLQYIYPREKQMEIDESNVGLLMELSDRFAISRVFWRCRRFLKEIPIERCRSVGLTTTHPNHSYSLDIFQIMQLADRYNLWDVQEYALQELSTVPSLNNYIEDHQTQYNMLSLSARHDILNLLRIRKGDRKNRESQPIAEPSDLAPWKLTDESTPHDRVLLVDGVKFYVQSQMLILWTPFFDKLFNSKVSEGPADEVELKDVDSRDFELLLQFIYPNEEHYYIGRSNVFALMDLSDRFAIRWVFERCRSFVMETYTSHFLLNFFQLMQLAGRHNLMDAQETALDYLLSMKGLKSYIADCQTDYDALSVASQYDVLNLFRLRHKAKRANRANRDSYHHAIIDYSSDSSVSSL